MVQNSLSEITERIKNILISEVQADPTKVGDSSTPLLGGGIGLDSIETLTLVTAIEREFNVQVDDGDLTFTLFTDLGTLANFVFQRVSQQQHIVRGGDSL
jgi:acyl carrier protein